MDTPVPDQISLQSLQTQALLNRLRDIATKHGIEMVVGALEPNGDIRLASNSDDQSHHDHVLQRLEHIKAERSELRVDRPPNGILIRDLQLWREWVDPYHIIRDDEFATLSDERKLRFIEANSP